MLWENYLMNFHIFLREEEPEMVEALDIEEGGDEDYWANTVILRQTVLFYLFFRLNVIILSSNHSKLWSIFLSCFDKVKFSEDKIYGVKYVLLVALLGQRLR